MSTQKKSTSSGSTFALIVLAIIIAAFPMFFNFGDKNAEEKFTGTDDGAESIVEQENPGYTPWAHPVISDLPSEVESGLFALQAGLGAGVVGFAIGNYRGRTKTEEKLLGSGASTTIATGPDQP